MEKSRRTESLGARPVLVVDFGAQYAQLIARRVREAHVYSEIVPHYVSVEDVRSKNPCAVILSGGPSSVYEPHAPSFDTRIFELDVPVFGICYGFQAMAQGLGGSVARTGGSEYGGTTLTVRASGTLLSGLPETQNVWMSHGDSVDVPPAGFDVLASSPGAPVAAFENIERRMAGVQFHPEVLHTAHGQRILEHFLWQIAECDPTWTMSGIIDEQVARIRDQVGDSRVVCGLSGGVDSAVAAALVQRAVGDQLTCIFVDHGLLRTGEVEQVQRDFVAATSSRKRGRAAVSIFWSRGRCTPTSWNPVADRARQTSRAITTSVASRTTWNSPWWNRCGHSSRMKFARSASTSGCRTRLSGDTRSRVRVWRSASSGR